MDFLNRDVLATELVTRYQVDVVITWDIQHRLCFS